MSAIDEDSLIKSRPLAPEERPFKRIRNRCSTIYTTAAELPAEELAKFSEAFDLDLTHFELSIARIQLLQDTNKREVERYEKEKVNILQASEKAREDMITLRESLALAQQEKANKLIYDAIATDILSSRTLRPRDEQRINLARLNQEIAELEEEKQRYGQVWQARREQFGEIVRQLEKMQAQIQEDKEEHDRREGMDEEEEGEEIEHPARPPPQSELASGATTPRSNAVATLTAPTFPLSSTPASSGTPAGTSSNDSKDTPMADTSTAKEEGETTGASSSTAPPVTEASTDASSDPDKMDTT